MSRVSFFDRWDARSDDIVSPSCRRVSRRLRSDRSGGSPARRFRTWLEAEPRTTRSTRSRSSGSTVSSPS